MQPGSNVGERISAGLPNIIGTVYNVDGGGQSTAADGAFQVVSQYAAHGRGTNNSTHSSFNFFASRSSEIYGSSSTVQPPSQIVHICIKYK